MMVSGNKYQQVGDSVFTCKENATIMNFSKDGSFFGTYNKHRREINIFKNYDTP